MRIKPLHKNNDIDLILSLNKISAEKLRILNMTIMKKTEEATNDEQINHQQIFDLVGFY